MNNPIDKFAVINGYAVIRGTGQVPPFRPTPLGKELNPHKDLGTGFVTTDLITEADPNGLHLNTPGAKADAGKVRPALVLGGFARALMEVSKVGTYGATKYTDNGWMEVPNGLDRYDDAGMRHWLTEKIGTAHDADTELLHAAHEAWNSLARLDLLVRKREKSGA